MARKTAVKAVFLCVVVLVAFCAFALMGATKSGSVVVRQRRSAAFAQNVTNESLCNVWMDRGELCANLSSLCPSASIVDYVSLFFCSGAPLALVVMFVAVEMLMLFFLLGASADKFLVPALRFISDTLAIPADIAGITLMALANGAPDVFGTVVAVKEFSYGISAGELLGAGLFVTTIVVGAVALVSKATVQQLPFLRDTGFYLLGIAMFFFLVLDGFVSLLDACLMLLYYLAYVVFAGFFSFREARRRELGNVALPSSSDVDESKVKEEGSVPLEPVEEMDHNGVDADFDSASDDISEVILVVGNVQPWWRIPLVNAILKKWNRKSPKGRVFWLFFAALRFPLTLTCIDVRWNKWLDCYQPAATFLFSPFVVVLACGLQSSSIGGVFPVWALGLVLGIVTAALMVIFLRRVDKPGRWVSLILSVWTFLLSIMWIYVLAHELVAILQALGKLLRISDAILGATVLAWGSSVGDTVSNILVAKHGLPESSIAAAFGGKKKTPKKIERFFLNLFFRTIIQLAFWQFNILVVHDHKDVSRAVSCSSSA